jgi:hypothetical protein
MMKLLIIVIFFVVGLAYKVIMRMLDGEEPVKYGSQELIDKLSRNPTFVHNVMEELYALYGKLPISDYPGLLDQVMNMAPNQSLRKYTVLKTYRVNENTVLCVTNCVDRGIVHSSSGNPRETDVLYEFNFAITQKDDKGIYEFYSELHEDLAEKNLRGTFFEDIAMFAKPSYSVGG